METEKNMSWNMVSEIELIYRSKVKPSKRPEIKTARAAYELLLSHWDDNTIELTETAIALLMNKANRVMGMYRMSTGGITGTVVDPRLLFAAALKVNASAFILAHNHPSGNLLPSQQDKAITEKLMSAGKFLDIKLLDHLIISTENYYSFSDEGLLY
ncbi:MAG: JAB domain-containing protein [Bacteroidota bacterium]